MNDLNSLTQNKFLLILSINLIPVLILFFVIPIARLRRDRNLLIIFLSFASGSLMADVFLRLVPYMIGTSKNSMESHGDNRTGLVILAGIFISFFIEKFFRHRQSTDEDEEEKNPTLAYLYLLADILYTYTNSRTLLPILFEKSIITQVIHHVLHLFNGYGILIYSGMSSAKAMRFQFITGLIGSIFSFIDFQFQSQSIVEPWIHHLVFPIIAGIFVYISCAHMIPEVIENHFGIKGALLKLGAFIISVSLIFLLRKDKL